MVILRKTNIMIGLRMVPCRFEATIHDFAKALNLSQFHRSHTLYQGTVILAHKSYRKRYLTPSISVLEGKVSQQGYLIAYAFKTKKIKEEGGGRQEKIGSGLGAGRQNGSTYFPDITGRGGYRPKCCHGCHPIQSITFDMQHPYSAENSSLNSDPCELEDPICPQSPVRRPMSIPYQSLNASQKMDQLGESLVLTPPRKQQKSRGSKLSMFDFMQQKQADFSIRKISL